MDIFVQNVPKHINHVELRLFLKPKLHECEVLAFDIYKKAGNNWAVVTVADPRKGNTFLRTYDERRGRPLIMHESSLRCKKSNNAGQPPPVKVIALLQREEELKTKQPRSVAQNLEATKSIFRFVSLTTGLWSNESNVLQYDAKFKDLRSGCVTFGRSALVIFLQQRPFEGYESNGRIDIPYTIIEHVVPTTEIGKQAALTFTLKSPPKIYQIQNDDGLHLYTGEAKRSGVTDLSHLFGNMSIHTNKQSPLRRLCSMKPDLTLETSLCMVYKLQFSSLQITHHAWNFIRDYTIPDVYCWKPMVYRKLTMDIQKDYEELIRSLEAFGSELDFAVQFQILVLVHEGTLGPSQMRDIVPCIWNVVRSYGCELTAFGIKKLGNQLPTPGPHISNESLHRDNIVKLIVDNIKVTKNPDSASTGVKERRKQSHLALVYKATVTPTGLLLRGPDWGVSNRVLRKYRDHTEYFMRVFFTDEDGQSVFHDPRASQDAVYQRFSKILCEGFTVATRKYDFLGFSHSSLRYHQAWFMAPFHYKDTLIYARDVIRDLGDFTRIRCSAKCAARIGQAFSDTIFSVPIPATACVTESKPDVKRNGRIFSDGCGTISLELMERVWKALPPDRRALRPTVLQIRYRGAKGVVSLDTSLHGEQLLIRESMTKYIAKDEWRDLELCGASYRPLVMYLNQQFIKILEDLKVSPESILDVQREALENLERMVKYPINAASFLEHSQTAVSARIPRLFELMHHIGLSFQTDKFLTDVVEIAAMANLRDMKYRARLPVADGDLLYGIMDETNTLKEGQVYITTSRPDINGIWRPKIIRRLVAVARAPALHPGDIQHAEAVDVLPGSPLEDLRNCIVFSQQGQRDLPSSLSGGDLDGDLYHVIYDQRLMPKFCYPPAEYNSAPPKDLGRAVEPKDIAKFFVEFMNMDRLGVISNKHKTRADLKPHGTLDPDCILLAKLASDAVDFSKSGNPANMSLIPRGTDYLRPDFMAPGHNLVINDLGAAELRELEEENFDNPDSLSLLNSEKQSVRYYRSDRVLGRLYRNIDEKKFFNQMKDDFRREGDNFNNRSLLSKLAAYVEQQTKGIQWEHHRAFAEGLREYYENNMMEIMNTMRPHRGAPLTELEVFSGNILGKKERASTRYIREANKEVQERFNRDVSEIIQRVISGNTYFDEEGYIVDVQESLPRSIACFKIALEVEGWENYVTLLSWKYVAAAVCLEQLQKFHGGRLRPFV